MQEKSNIEYELNRFNSFFQEYNDLLEMLQIAEEENDDALITEIENLLFSFEKKVRDYKIESLLSDDADKCACYLEIHPGAGGTEAQDWALMLMRMYLRFAESSKYKVEILEDQYYDVGIKSCTLKIEAPMAYGWLKFESGIHRLVRISPFDANAKRHTSFASVWVYPVVDDNIDIVIEEKDLRIDTYRASGAGGQHVNKTDSAVRMTHIPTNIVVQCQNDRSQHRNRASAMNMLKARLYELERRKQMEASVESQSAKTEIGWGNQIRSYVLHPYQMVKDLRSGVEKGNALGVLDGDLWDFLKANIAVIGGEEQ